MFMKYEEPYLPYDAILRYGFLCFTHAYRAIFLLIVGMVRNLAKWGAMSL